MLSGLCSLWRLCGGENLFPGFFQLLEDPQSEEHSIFKSLPVCSLLLSSHLLLCLWHAYPPLIRTVLIPLGPPNNPGWSIFPSHDHTHLQGPFCHEDNIFTGHLGGRRAIFYLPHIVFKYSFPRNVLQLQWLITRALESASHGFKTCFLTHSVLWPWTWSLVSLNPGQSQCIIELRRMVLLRLHSAAVLLNLLLQLQRRHLLSRVGVEVMYIYKISQDWCPCK